MQFVVAVQFEPRISVVVKKCGVDIDETEVLISVADFFALTSLLPQ